MTDAKAYLTQVELYDTHINNKLEELQRLKEFTRQITSTLKKDVVATSGKQDKLGDAIAKIVDLETEINEAIDAYIDKRRDVDRLINRLTEPDQVAVLHKRYFEYKTWPQIAKEMHMAERTVQYTHGRALQSVRLLLANGGAE
jgi:DNA-directed RNA polymerase specialized sigma24 family protein